MIERKAGACEGIVHQSGEAPCRDRNNAGAVIHGRKGTNKNTNRVVRARACPRSFGLTLCF